MRRNSGVCNISRFITTLILWFLVAGCGNSDLELFNDLSFPYSTRERIVAHRGVWNVEGGAQNSLDALSRTGELGLWGAEIDVRMTDDCVWVLNHDDYIDEIYIGSCCYTDLNSHTIANGEPIPTIEEAMEIRDGYPEMSLMVEIKSGDASQLSRKLSRQDTDHICFISFSKSICETLLGSGFTDVYLLLTDIDDANIEYLDSFGYKGVSVAYETIYEQPHKFRSLKDAGFKVVAWTVNNPEEIMRLLAMGVDLIATDCADKLVFDEQE